MNLKKKIVATKYKIKNHVPEIMGFGIVAVSVVATLAAKHLLDSQSGDLHVNHEDLNYMKTKDRDFTMTYSSGGSDYSLRYLGNTPPN